MESQSLLLENFHKAFIRCHPIPKAVMMSVKKMPLGPLILACKAGDKKEVERVMESIIQSGISKPDLNFVDQSGRTALSHIAATPHTAVLRFLLRFKGIEVDTPDNDGNTPLHFAAESGQTDMVAMLISHSRNTTINAINAFGLTPLMKASVQGQTDCAIKLIGANASLSLKDPIRGFTAKDWAHHCGRKFCADSLGELIKKRKAAQLFAFQGGDPTNRQKTSVPAKVDCQQAGRDKGNLASQICDLFNRPKATTSKKVMKQVPAIMLTTADGLTLQLIQE